MHNEPLQRETAIERHKKSETERKGDRVKNTIATHRGTDRQRRGQIETEKGEFTQIQSRSAFVKILIYSMYKVTCTGVIIMCMYLNHCFLLSGR